MFLFWWLDISRERMYLSLDLDLLFWLMLLCDSDGVLMITSEFLERIWLSWCFTWGGRFLLMTTICLSLSTGCTSLCPVVGLYLDLLPDDLLYNATNFPLFPGESLMIAAILAFVGNWIGEHIVETSTCNYCIAFLPIRTLYAIYALTTWNSMIVVFSMNVFLLLSPGISSLQAYAYRIKIEWRSF